jgi:hypothetical protein
MSFHGSTDYYLQVDLVFRTPNKTEIHVKFVLVLPKGDSKIMSLNKLKPMLANNKYRKRATHLEQEIVDPFVPSGWKVLLVNIPATLRQTRSRPTQALAKRQAHNCAGRILWMTSVVPPVGEHHMIESLNRTATLWSELEDMHLARHKIGLLPL